MTFLSWLSHHGHYSQHEFVGCFYLPYFYVIVINRRRVVLCVLICGVVGVLGTTGDRKPIYGGAGDGIDGNDSRVGFDWVRSCVGSFAVYGRNAF